MPQASRLTLTTPDSALEGHTPRPSRADLFTGSQLTTDGDVKSTTPGWFDVGRRQLDRDRRADAARARDRNRSAVQLDVALRDGEPESRPGRLRREVRLEGLRQRFPIHAAAGCAALD